MTNRFRIRDLKQRPEELWTGGSQYHIGVSKPSSKEKEMQEVSKVVVEGGFTNSLGRRSGKAREEGEVHPNPNAGFKRTVRRDKKAFLVKNSKK